MDGVLRRPLRGEGDHGLPAVHRAFRVAEEGAPSLNRKPGTFRRLDLKPGSARVVPTGCQA